MGILKYTTNLFYKMYYYIATAVMYLLGFSNKTPFILVSDEQKSFSETVSCSDIRQSNTCTQRCEHSCNVEECDEKCDYKWDRILSTRQITRSYADAFPGLSEKSCGAQF